MERKRERGGGGGRGERGLRGREERLGEMISAEAVTVAARWPPCGTLRFGRTVLERSGRPSCPYALAPDTCLGLRPEAEPVPGAHDAACRGGGGQGREGRSVLPSPGGHCRRGAYSPPLHPAAPHLAKRRPGGSSRSPRTFALPVGRVSGERARTPSAPGRSRRPAWQERPAPTASGLPLSSRASRSLTVGPSWTSASRWQAVTEL